MRFWDSSALVPLLVAEKQTPILQSLYLEDPVLLVWWGTEVECVSALGRLERSGGISPPAMEEALGRLRDLRSVWQEIQPGPRLREVACRLLRTHPLRSPDATQLAAAIIASLDRPSTLGFVCADERLVGAARKEGFPVPGLSSL